MKASATETVSEQTDSQIVAEVRDGDQEQYRSLVERYERKVYAIAWARLGDPDLAEEAAQETFINAYRKISWLKDGARFGAWIGAIARNVSINLGLRRRHEMTKRERWGLFQDEACAVDLAEEAPVTSETLRQTLSTLSAGHRECLVLFYLEGKSVADASAALGISPVAFKTRLHRARAALRHQLETRLESSLGQLRPSQPLAPAIMVLLSGQSAEAAAAGGGLGVLAKAGGAFLKALPFQFLMVGIMFLGFIPAWLLSRVERRNYLEPDGFRARFYQSAVVKGLLFGVATMIVLYFAGSWTAGIWEKHGLQRVMGVLLLAVMIPLSRILAINRGRFVVGHFAANATLGVGMAGVGFLGWPEPVFSLCFAGFFAWLAWAIRDLPLRMDYNLFLRQSQAMLRVVDADRERSGSMPALTRTDLFAFARFLAERWLVADYRCRGDSLALRLPPAKPAFLASVCPWLWRGASVVTLSARQTVTAELGHTDAGVLATMHTRCNPAGTVEDEVSRALEHAWSSFRRGDFSAAERGLGHGSEEEIFHAAPSRVTRWRQGVMVFASVGLAIVTITEWVHESYSPRQFRHLRAVSVTAAEVRGTLMRLERPRAEERQAWNVVDAWPWMVTALPPRSFFTDAAWSNIEGGLWDLGRSAGRREDKPAADVIRTVLHSELWQKALISGLLTSADVAAAGVTPAAVRAHLEGLSPRERQALFELERVGVQNQPFTVLELRWLTWRLQMLKWYDCLDLAPRGEIVATLRESQVRGERAPAGRRPMSNPKLVEGLFHATGYDSFRDTYYALVCLSVLDSLDKIDAAACVRGILRLHLGRGLFGASGADPNSGLPRGDAQATFFAYESLRMLNALDQVKDLDRWQFRPGSTSTLKNGEGNGRVLTAEEIEAWLSQERLNEYLARRRSEANVTAPSLLTGEDRGL
jgi:RNA polymerase sigma factor (sigma-70 family)